MESLGFRRWRDIELAFQLVPAEIILAKRKPDLSALGIQARKRAVTLFLERSSTSRCCEIRMARTPFLQVNRIGRRL
jgi:hypothetical protein